jgi:hypothetical protein
MTGVLEEPSASSRDGRSHHEPDSRVTSRPGIELVAAAAILGGFLHHYYVLFLRPEEAAGRLEGYYRAIVNGVDAAPYQYRVLVPRLVVWLHDVSGLQFRLVAVFVDGAALFAGGLAVLALLRALRLQQWTVVAALYIAFLGYGTTTFWKPESFVAFFAASLLGLVYVRHDEPGSDLLLVLAGAVLVGTRTDVLAAFAVAYAVRWLYLRRRADALRAAAILVSAIASTAVLVAFYPHAHYPAQTSLLQIGHSLRPNNLLIPLLFLLPPLIPLWRLRHRLRTTVGIDVIGLLTAVAAFSAASLVVARIDEVRLWFPLAGVIAAIGAAAWTNHLRTSTAAIRS